MSLIRIAVLFLDRFALMDIIRIRLEIPNAVEPQLSAIYHPVVLQYTLDIYSCNKCCVFVLVDVAMLHPAKNLYFVFMLQVEKLFLFDVNTVAFYSELRNTQYNDSYNILI